MNKDRAIGVGALALLLTFGTPLTGMAMSFAQYYSLETYQQENFISTVLHYYYFNYANDPQQAFKSACMLDFDNNQVRDEGGALYSYVVANLEEARATTEHNGTVEGVVKAMIDRECANR